MKSPYPFHLGARVPLSRYRTIIPDWERFEEVVSTPEPVTFRVRSGRVTSDRLLPRLEAQGFVVSSVPGVDGFFQVVRGPGSVAQTLEHWLGLFHVQQAVMGLPVLALDPLPGERILDLCAAPGGKTAHLAELMGDRGPLVAVDPKEKRLRGLLGNLYRLGHPNVLVVAADGRNLPAAASFDRVLVDAPCSAEGNMRRQSGRIARRDPGFVAHVTSVQEALLRRALALVRPGGTVLYSTCTFAPEENEAVVSRVLADTAAEVEPIVLDVPHAPGLTSWEGGSFHPQLRHAWRVYPHHLDSGGLFMARMRRLPDLDGTDRRPPPFDGAGAHAPVPVGWSALPEAFPGEQPADARARLDAAQYELVQRFGFRLTFLTGLHWMVRGDSIWASTAEMWPVPAWTDEAGAKRWRVVSLGIRALRRRGPGLETPSGHFLARWGNELSPERQIHLQTSELRSLLSDQAFPAEGRPAGPVALFWDGWTLGRGMIGARGLVHEIPRASADRLRTLLGIAPVPEGNAPQRDTE